MTPAEEALVAAALAWRRHVTGEYRLARADLDGPTRALFDAAEAVESEREKTPPPGDPIP